MGIGCGILCCIGVLVMYFFTMAERSFKAGDVDTDHGESKLDFSHVAPRKVTVVNMHLESIMAATPNLHIADMTLESTEL